MDDYLTKEEKLACLVRDGSILKTATTELFQDSHGDWFDHRDSSLSKLIIIGEKKKSERIFSLYSSGLKAARDAWVFGSSKEKIKRNVEKMFGIYNQQASDYDEDPENFVFIRDEKLIHWNQVLEDYMTRGDRNLEYDPQRLYTGIYRPFNIQHCYFDRYANDRVYRLKSIFPSNEDKNLLICCSGVGAKEFSCLMVDRIPCLDFLEKTQCFPRWLPKSDIKAALV